MNIPNFPCETPFDRDMGNGCAFVIILAIIGLVLKFFGVI